MSYFRVFYNPFSPPFSVDPKFNLFVNYFTTWNLLYALECFDEVILGCEVFFTLFSLVTTVLYFNHKNRFSEGNCSQIKLHEPSRERARDALNKIESRFEFQSISGVTFCLDSLIAQNCWSWISYNNLKHSFTRTCHYFLCTFRTGYKNKIFKTWGRYK